MGQTLGILGMGRIGWAVAQRAYAFGMQIVFYDPMPIPRELVQPFHGEAKTLDEVIAESHVLSLHLPLTDETRHLLNIGQLRRMQRGALIVNTARGGLIDETALYEALHEGHLAGAACDVFDQEPPGANPLLQLEHFIATPHAGSATRQTTLRMGLMAAENTLTVLRGERPPHLVNPEVYDVLTPGL
jgi:phosphoglycerate dehydrogenase-like enzyme